MRYLKIGKGIMQYLSLKRERKMNKGMIDGSI